LLIGIYVIFSLFVQLRILTRVLDNRKMAQGNIDAVQASPLISNNFLIPALVTFLVLLLSSLVYIIWRKLSSKADSVILVGLNGSGKTRIFTKLINSSPYFIRFAVGS
jgi:signal recognition particle GTPase